MRVRGLVTCAILIGAGFAACVPGFASRHDILGAGGGATTGTGGHGGTGGVAPATCSDGIKNAEETGVDCGGKTCKPCPLGQGCATVADCAGAGGVDAGATPLVQCIEGVCVPPVVGKWLQAAAGPTARVDASMTYDPFNHQTVLVAGTVYGTTTPLLDTWFWDGATWLALSPQATFSGNRYGALFVDEPPRDRALMFSGCTVLSMVTATRSDVLEWDGQLWTPLSLQTVPPPRCFSATAYDAARKRVVLFGGEDQTPTFLGDVWEWNGATWAPAPAVAKHPSVRSRASAAYDAARGLTVMFGGVRGPAPETRFDETWTWDGAMWAHLQPAVHPGQRSDLAMAYDARRRRVVLFGGKPGPGSLGLQDTWEWDGAQWTEISLPPGSSPAKRFGHSMTFDADRGRVVMFGGAADGVTWEYVAGAGACASTASCDDTYTCVDGLCCEQSSCGGCQACNVPGSAGTCGPLPAGTKDPACKTPCDGSGVCK